MTVYKGREGTAKLGGSTVGEVKSFSVDITAQMTDSTRMGDIFTKDEMVHGSWSGEMDVFWDPNDIGQTAAFGGATIIGNQVIVALYPRGITGFPAVNITGTVTIEGMTIKQSHDDLIGRTFKFKGYGVPSLNGM